ncbi:MAG: cysteine synthase family protein [Polyangiaceae bacterium]|nr:cysteine synthase family protein [Polyangiaceae bacterium]
MASPQQKPFVCQTLPSEGCILQIPPTPLVPVKLGPEEPLIWCKLEFLNPSGSTKDRIAAHILGKAWRQGRLKKGDLVVEASSGSTSIAMAMVCAQLGLRFIAIMPEGVSNERSLIIRAFGGEVRKTPRDQGIVGAIAETERIAREERAFCPRQFENPENAEAHRFGTAHEIVSQLPGGTLEAFVSGVGTGGTLVGLYQGFRDQGIPAKPVAAIPIARGGDPSKGVGCFHAPETCCFSSRIPGVIERMSKIYQPDALEGIEELEIEDETALATARKLIREGFPVGPSSGLNYAAALEIARRLGPGAVVVTVLPDRMERYFSTELFGC